MTKISMWSSCPSFSSSRFFRYAVAQMKENKVSRIKWFRSRIALKTVHPPMHPYQMLSSTHIPQASRKRKSTRESDKRRRRHRLVSLFHASALRRHEVMFPFLLFARDLCRDDDDDDDNKVSVLRARRRRGIALDIGRDIFSSKAEETETSLTTLRPEICVHAAFLCFFCMGRFPVFSPILPIFVHLL